MTTGENVAAVGTSVLSLVIPLIVVPVVLVLVVVLIVVFKKRFFRGTRCRIQGSVS